jgi:exopolyphosphatase/guanosine-5'-triphosphate,3'-diphosphate pyrophosphatase
MKTIRFAAIDIGSNAVRLLITCISPDDSKKSYRKLLKIRFSLRLGQDSFVSGYIHEDKVDQLIRVMGAFSDIIKAYRVTDYRACATSAMRDASNSKEIIQKIRGETGINLDIIDGQEEAFIISRGQPAGKLKKKQNYLFVDVGGGSTEISLIAEGKPIRSKSYNIGTVRLLNDNVKRSEYDQLDYDLQAMKELYPVKDIIGSGGNIVRLNALARFGKNDKLPLKVLKNLNETLKLYSAGELIEKFGLKPDSADLITLAADIYINVAKSIGAENYIVPKKKLIDGIIHSLYLKWRDENERGILK